MHHEYGLYERRHDKLYIMITMIIILLVNKNKNNDNYNNRWYNQESLKDHHQSTRVKLMERLAYALASSSTLQLCNILKVDLSIPSQHKPCISHPSINLSCVSSNSKEDALLKGAFGLGAIDSSPPTFGIVLHPHLEPGLRKIGSEIRQTHSPVTYGKYHIPQRHWHGFFRTIPGGWEWDFWIINSTLSYFVLLDPC